MSSFRIEHSLLTAKISKLQINNMENERIPPHLSL
jgi:hypothetical protein